MRTNALPLYNQIVSTIVIIFLTHYTNVKYNSNISPNNSKIRDDRVKLLQGNWVL